MEDELCPFRECIQSRESVERGKGTVLYFLNEGRCMYQEEEDSYQLAARHRSYERREIQEINMSG